MPGHGPVDSSAAALHDPVGRVEEQRDRPGAAAKKNRIQLTALPQIGWVDYRCRAEFIRPTAIIATGDKEVTMPCVAFAGPNSFGQPAYDALRRGIIPCPSVYCLTTFTRGRHLWMSDEDETPLVE